MIYLVTSEELRGWQGTGLGFGSVLANQFQYHRIFLGIILHVSCHEAARAQTERDSQLL